MEYIGTITKARGFKGDMFLSDVPKEIEIISNEAEVIVGYSSAFGKKFIIESFNKKEKNAIVKFKEINSDETVLKLKEQGVFTDKINIIIEKDKKALIDDIIGCEVYDNDDNTYVGNIIDVWYLPGNDVYYVKTKKGNIPLPVIDEVIIRTEFENDKVYVHFIEGLWALLEE